MKSVNNVSIIKKRNRPIQNTNQKYFQDINDTSMERSHSEVLFDYFLKAYQV